MTTWTTMWTTTWMTMWRKWIQAKFQDMAQLPIDWLYSAQDPSNLCLPTGCIATHTLWHAKAMAW